MCERARRSRDSSSRYSIETLFPGLSVSKGEGGGHEELDLGEQELGTVDPSDTFHGTRIQKVRKVMTKGGSRCGSSTRDLVVNPPRDDHQDNGTHLSSLSSSTPTTPPHPPSTTPPHPPSASRRGAATKAKTKPPPLPASKSEKRSSSVKTSGRAVKGTATKRRASSPLKPTSLHPCKQITGPLSGTLTTPTTRMSRIGMMEAFQPWVLSTYGDSAKTKTITRKKYTRIIKTLRGEEINNAENSKFRFWVKAKGFTIGFPPGFGLGADDLRPNDQPHLCVPTTVKDEGGIERPVYKRVAVVESFFEIIYTVHVETEAKNGKHAGQKRTYRAITEKYAFLPREAVTKFLLQCTECQKRGSPNGDHQLMSVNGKSSEITETGTLGPDNTIPLENGLPGSLMHSPTLSPTLFPNLSETLPSPPPILSPAQLPSYDINFTLPFTTTYLRKQKKQMRLQNGLPLPDFLPDEDDSRLSNPSSLDDDHDHIVEPMPKKKSKNLASSDRNHLNGTSLLDSGVDVVPGGVDWLGYHPIALKKERLTPTSSTNTCSNNNSIYSNGKNEFKEQSSPLSLSSAVIQETGQDETSSNGNKDDEDDDDDESEDKIDTHPHDPERLKAFNMFVRLFVDENLDRMVPISKQPKEKIQAIIDSCTRQFPEFAERARKRIRTYLKSCRRNKRSRDSSWESSRPTPAHLTSVQAEQILAQACENESQNAKRMRMGLEPVGQPLPASVMQNGIRTEPSAILNGKDEKEHGSSGSSSSASTPDKVSTTVATKMSAATFGTGSTTPNSISGGGGGGGGGGAILSSVVEPIQNGGTTSVKTPLSSSGSENQISTGTKSGTTTTERNHLLDYSSSRPPLNGNALTNMSMYRPNFCQAFTRPFTGIFPTGTGAAGSTPPSVGGGIGGNMGVTGFGGNGVGAGGLENCLPNGGSHNNRTFSSHNVSSLPILPNGNEIGPTDLSMKSKPLMNHKLNTTEMSTVRQLITGYRESAAFLLRSADELEQLIIQQQ